MFCPLCLDDRKRSHWRIQRPVNGRVCFVRTRSGGAFHAAYTERVRYTIRGVPSAVDAAIRRRARASGKSLNEAALAALMEGAGIAGKGRKRRDLADIAGTWKTDQGIESALGHQDLVDDVLDLSRL